METIPVVFATRNLDLDYIEVFFKMTPQFAREFIDGHILQECVFEAIVAEVRNLLYRKTRDRRLPSKE